MAVLVEGISVIVQRAAIDSKLEGGWPKFMALIPNQTLCEDGELARVGFLDPKEVGAFIDQLEALGLQYMGEAGAAGETGPIDMIVCDQQRGPVTDCGWLEFSHLGIDGGQVGAAWLWRGERKGYGVHMRADMTIAMPAGWHFKESLSDKFEFVPNNLASQRTDH